MLLRLTGGQSALLPCYRRIFAYVTDKNSRLHPLQKRSSCNSIVKLQELHSELQTQFNYVFVAFDVQTRP